MRMTKSGWPDSFPMSAESPAFIPGSAVPGGKSPGVNKIGGIEMLKQINNRFYKYFDKNANMLFTFEKGGIGVCSIGECWRLRLTFSNQQTLVACFVTYDDHHNAAKQYSLHGRIWSEREALSEANKMVAEFIED